MVALCRLCGFTVRDIIHGRCSPLQPGGTTIVTDPGFEFKHVGKHSASFRKPGLQAVPGTDNSAHCQVAKQLRTTPIGTANSSRVILLRVFPFPVD